MRISYILAGLVFLFNPHINIIDILPDAIGYGLILYGILRLSRVDVNMSACAVHAKRLLVLSLVKLGCLYAYSLLSGEEQLWTLLLSAGFGAAEAVMGFLLFASLFHAVDTLAVEGRDGLFYKRLPSARLMTYLFVIVKPLMAVLPDLTLLADDRYGVMTETGIQSIRNFRTVFTVFSFALTLVFGIIWLVTVLRFFSALKREKALLADMEDKITAFETVDTRRHFRYLITACSLWFYAILFCLELKIEGYSLLPPMIAAALFAALSYLLFRFYKESDMKKTALISLVSSLLYFVFSTVGYITAKIFADSYYYEDVGGGFANDIYYLILRDFDVFDELLLVNFFVLLSQVAFGVMTVMLVKLAHRMIDGYCGTPESMLTEKDRTEAMIERDKATDTAAKRALHRATLPFLVTSLITALSSAIFPMLEVYFNEFFMIDLALRVIYVIVASSFAVKLKNAIKVKGALDFD